ncbi:MAG TPA: hypothetical protein VGS61_07645, partial [Acidimicrobiales bacterium]|nr:hypothetical protein [Acidimicrobiales bacterium]
ARALVVGGFALTTVAGVAYILLLAHLGYFRSGQSLAADGVVIVPVLSDAAALLGWWWLTRLVVTEPDQMTLVRRAYYAIGVQYLLTATWEMCNVSLEHTVNTTDQLVMASLIVGAIGGLGAFVGFTVIAGVYTPRRELPRELPRESARAVEDDDE